METFSALLAICAGNSPVPGEFPTQSPVTRSFDVFFDLRLNKRLSKQSSGWWFATPSHPLWRHRNGIRWNWMFIHMESYTTTSYEYRDEIIYTIHWIFWVKFHKKLLMKIHLKIRVRCHRKFLMKLLMKPINFTNNIIYRLVCFQRVK